MSLGDFTAFNTYLGILIFPILIIGFMSNVIAQAQASYARIGAVLTATPRDRAGTLKTPLTGAISVRDLSVAYAGKQVLKDVSFDIAPGTRTAIIGPTAAGKSQLLYLMTGLLAPTSGTVTYDGHDIHEYDKEFFHSHIGFVFQDSVLFNLTLRENIAFNTTVQDKDLKRAIDTAELHDFVGSLPNGLDTVVSERGTSLSGGRGSIIGTTLGMVIFGVIISGFTYVKVSAYYQEIIMGIIIVSAVVLDVYRQRRRGRG